MAKGDLHLETGTICKAEIDERCPYAGGHVESLESFADFYGADADTLKGLVENARMNPRSALQLMGEGIMQETPKPATKSPEPSISPAQEQPQERAPDSARQRYERELHQYKIDMRAYEDRMLSRYAEDLELSKESSFAPRPTPPPFRTVYPQSFERYDQMPKDLLPEGLPEEIQNRDGAADLWEEYLRKRKQMGDINRTPVYYL